MPIARDSGPYRCFAPRDLPIPRQQVGEQHEDLACLTGVCVVLRLERIHVRAHVAPALRASNIQFEAHEFCWAQGVLTATLGAIRSNESAGHALDEDSPRLATSRWMVRNHTDRIGLPSPFAFRIILIVSHVSRPPFASRRHRRQTQHFDLFVSVSQSKAADDSQFQYLAAAHRLVIAGEQKPRNHAATISTILLAPLLPYPNE